jgi:hypothetical protein
MRFASATAFMLTTVLGAMQCHALIFVISDADYQNPHVLPNPINDARDVAELRMVIAADHEATAPLSAAEERMLKPKDSFKECAQCPEWWSRRRAASPWVRRMVRRDGLKRKGRSTA